MVDTVIILIIVIVATFALLLIACIIGDIDDSKWKINNLFKR